MHVFPKLFITLFHEVARPIAPVTGMDLWISKKSTTFIIMRSPSLYVDNQKFPLRGLVSEVTEGQDQVSSSRFILPGDVVGEFSELPRHVRFSIIYFIFLSCGADELN